MENNLQQIVHKSLSDSKKKAEEKEKTTPFQVKVNRTPLDMFRYSLAGLLVAVKLGLFSYLSVNPLATVSWWLVLLPAYVIEAALLAFLVALGVGAVLVILVYVLWLAFRYVVIDPIQKKRLKKKLDEAEKTGESTGDPKIDLLMALRKAVGGLGEKPPEIE